MKITIAIPNFNGGELLKKNLPNILESDADELLIIDDASKDQSWKLLSELKIENSKLKIIEHKKNKGFILTVNELFQEANGDIIVLLNNDVWVEKDFLEPLYKHFENEKVFAVNLHEEGEGPAKSFWKDGFYQFKEGEERKEVQKSAWASGGSAAFRKSVWNKLGGFDKNFSPFYWEDTDISYRALKAGFEILWEPNSRVKHEHETTINKSFSKRYISWVQQRNQLLFIWKNITDDGLRKEHQKALLMRLFGGMGLGYWIVFLWALLKFHKVKEDFNQRTDQEVINYAKD